MTASNHGYKKKHLYWDETQLKIESLYLKGLSIEDLSFQFDCDVDLIEHLLKERGIQLADNKVPSEFFFFKKQIQKKHPNTFKWIRKKYPNAYKQWSKADDNKLELLFCDEKIMLE